MLSAELNDRITLTGPKAPAGTLMRRYWQPAALVDELGGNRPLKAIRLLGEDLVAFRDSSGKVGFVAENCAHRGASLYFGRNEECGLRCVYHGWKFDVAGACVDMMNEPEENDFKHKVRMTAYPTCEMGGVIWAYLGPAEKMPPLPKFAWTQSPESHRHVTKVIQECNWLQALEGGWLSAESIEAGRITAAHAVRGEGRLFIRVFPHKSVTSIPAETRMGKGKGEPEYWAAVIKPGMILFEIGGLPEAAARDTLARVAYKMPFRCRFVSRRPTVG